MEPQAVPAPPALHCLELGQLSCKNNNNNNHRIRRTTRKTKKHNNLSTCLRTCLPTNLPTNQQQPTYLPIYLPTNKNNHTSNQHKRQRPTNSTPEIICPDITDAMNLEISWRHRSRRPNSKVWRLFFRENRPGKPLHLVLTTRTSKVDFRINQPSEVNIQKKKKNL